MFLFSALYQHALEHFNKPKKYPPFFDVAEKFGIEVSYKPLKYDYYGKYNKNNDSIELCSESAVTYYHELAHALDNRLNGELKKSSERRNEIVAEFTAVVLCQLSGIEAMKIKVTGISKVIARMKSQTMQF